MKNYLSNITNELFVYFTNWALSPNQVKDVLSCEYFSSNDIATIIFELQNESYLIGKFSAYSARFYNTDNVGTELKKGSLICEKDKEWQKVIIRQIDDKYEYLIDLFNSKDNQTDYHP